MRRWFSGAFGAALISAAAGCGNEPAESPENGSSAVPDTLSLAVVDTIGVETGDSVYVFGMIMKAAHEADGSVIVLDIQKACLSRYSRDGEFLGYIGAPGSGPGEFQMPMDFAVFPEGGLAVTDMISRVVSVFDGSGQYAGQTGNFHPAPPLRIEGGSGGAIIGQHMPMEVTEDQVTASADVARWAAGSPETEITFLSLPMEMQSAGGGVVTGSAFPELDLAVGPDGSVYVVEISDSLFSLRGLDRDGNETLSIIEPMDRVPLSQEEIDAGNLGMAVMIRDGQASAMMERSEVTDQWRNIISSVGTDAVGRIWVEMGCYDQPLFRVYSPGGELLFLARPDGDFPQVGRPAFRVDGGGILAYDRDPVDWPKVYVLELAEN